MKSKSGPARGIGMEEWKVSAGLTYVSYVSLFILRINVAAGPDKMLCIR